LKTIERLQEWVTGNSNGGSSSRRGMGRREAVQRMIAGPAGSLLVSRLTLRHPIHQQMPEMCSVAANPKTIGEEWTPEFLDAHQNETLIALAECVIPGSTAAHVNRFIDLLLTVDTQENKEHFLASLGAFEAESRSRFGRSFLGLTQGQQTQVLQVASTAEAGNAPVHEDWMWFSVPSRSSSEPIRITFRDRFENLKSWITRAYYSSEAGMRELGWMGNYFHESFPGCEHRDGHTLS
jgi:hypothetical protein